LTLLDIWVRKHVKRITEIGVCEAEMPREVYVGLEYLKRCMCDHMAERDAYET
jgi:hypothetical protein